MTNDVVINNKRQELSNDEMSKAADFHKNRIAFAFVNKKIVFNTDSNDDRDHMHWIMEDYNLTQSEFETLNRGYISEGKIFLHKGTSFDKVMLNDISLEDIVQLIDKHNDFFSRETILVYNGMKIGKIGEIWKPLSCIFIIKNIE